METKTILGVISVTLGVIGNGAYFRSAWKKHTKPHAFSWIIWSLLAGIGFFAQITKQAGAGAWALGATSILCFIGAVISLFWGE
jgi:hypothetical protein